jgi:PilZ domain-containing protein
MMAAMAHFPQSQRNVRAPRVRVPEAKRVILTAENARISGTLQNLSFTGGSVELMRDCNPGMLAELQMQTDNGPVQALVEILGSSPGPGLGHAFRFVALSDSDHERLCQAVSRLRRKGYAENSFGSGF